MQLLFYRSWKMEVSYEIHSFYCYIVILKERKERSLDYILKPVTRKRPIQSLPPSLLFRLEYTSSKYKEKTWCFMLPANHSTRKKSTKFGNSSKIFSINTYCLIKWVLPNLSFSSKNQPIDKIIPLRRGPECNILTTQQLFFYSSSIPLKKTVPFTAAHHPKTNQ